MTFPWLSEVSQHDGVVRTATLFERGASKYQIARAVSAGELLRVRRGWVALPSADPALIAAAHHAVVLTCTTQAERLGLWVHEAPTTFHVAAREGSGAIRSDRVHVHWARPLIQRGPDMLTDPIENVLAAVAECEPFEQALATWDSALRKGLVDKRKLARMRLRPAAREICKQAWQFSDAGLESYFRPRLWWMRIPMRFQISIEGRSVDVLIGDCLVVQIDGGTHVGAQRSKDIRFDAELRLLGYHVVRVSYEQVMHRWPEVQHLIMECMAQQLHEFP